MKKIIIFLVAFICFDSNIKAQNPTYSCKITNAAQVSCNAYEFDLILQRTGTPIFKLAQFQFGINMASGIRPVGGVITVAPVPGSSEISNAAQQPTPDRFTFDSVNNCIRVTPMSPPGYGAGSIITNNSAGTRLCRVRVTCSLPFNLGVSTAHAWSFSIASGYQTKVFAYVQSTPVPLNTDVTVQASHVLTGAYNAFTSDFTIHQQLDSIKPNHGNLGSIDTATIYGNFHDVNAVMLSKSGNPDFNLPYHLTSGLNCGNEITATIYPVSQAQGYWNLVVITTDSTMILPNAFMIDSTLVQPPTVIFHENFDPPSNTDSVIANGATFNFSMNTRLHYSGTQCDSASVSPSDTAYLTTIPFTTLGYSNVSLSFAHICKIEISDRARIQVSTNNGNTWITLDSAQYVSNGTSQFGTFNGYNYFHSNTYPSLWQPLVDMAQPTQAWWKNETFNIGAIAGNQANVRVRFALSDGDGNGAFFNHGWYIDDIKVTSANIPGGQCQANFTPSYNQATDTLKLFDQSYNLDSSQINISSWHWTVTIGGTVYNYFNQNPKVYLNGYTGNVPVCLTINTSSASPCQSSYCSSVIIAPPTVCAANFSYIIDTIQMTGHFTDLSSTSAGNIVAWNWTVQQNGVVIDSSHLQNPNFPFPSNGIYNVCLRVWSSSGCTDLKCDTVFLNIIQPLNEIELAEVVTPVNGCTFNTEVVRAKFINHGTAAINTPFNAGYYILPSAVPVLETVNVIIPPGDSIIYTFATLANLPVTSGNHTYTLRVFGNVAGGPFLLDDTLSKAVTLTYSPPPPVCTGATVNYGTSAILNAVSVFPVNWFSLPNGGSSIGTGSTFNTPPLYSTTIYYAEATNMITGTTTVGTGGNNSSFVPLARAYNYGWSSSLYTPSELGFAGRIDTIEFNVYNAISVYNMLDQKIYLKQVSGSPFANLDYPLVSSMTLVYQGPITYSAGWVKIPLTTPFMYDGVSNLELTYENHYGTYGTGPAFFASNVATNMVKYQKSNASFPTITGVVSTLRANTKFVHSSEGCPSQRVPDTAFVNNPPPDTCIAAFTYQDTTTHVVHFYDQSTTTNGNIISWSWVISKNGTLTYTSNLQYPAFTFQPNVLYLVCLNITTDSGCSTNLCQNIMVQDTNCQISVSYIVNHVSVINGSDGSIDLTVTGGIPPYTYAWNTGDSTQDIYNLQSGTYSVAISTISACPVYTYNYTVLQPFDSNNVIIDTLYSPIIDTCLNSPIDSFYIASINVVGTTVSVDWVFVGGGSVVTLTVDYTFSNVGAQLLVLTINCNGAKDLTTFMSYIYIHQAAGVNENAADPEIILYPNPVSDILYITFSKLIKNPISFKIYSSMGQQVYNKSITDNSTQVGINVSDLSSGVYFVKIDLAYGKQYVKKFIK